MFFHKQKSFVLLSVLTFVGCASDTNIDSNPNLADAPTSQPAMDTNTGEYIEEAQSVFITGRISSVDDIPLSDAQIAIADESLQIVEFTTSDEDGMYSLTLEEIGSYDLLAYWQNDSTGVGTVEQLILSDENSYIVNLVLDEIPPSSEVDDDNASPPGACYAVYDQNETYCQFGVLYMLRYYTGSWWCFWVFGYDWLPVASC